MSRQESGAASRKRGAEFQEEIRQSWRLVQGIWRTRINDNGRGSRPADELVLLPYNNLLIEHKRTSGKYFKLSMLESAQVTGLHGFDMVMPRNLGLVFIHFQDEDEQQDTCYAFRLTRMLGYMRANQVKQVSRDLFTLGRIPFAVEIKKNPLTALWDLESLVVQCYKL